LDFKNQTVIKYSYSTVDNDGDGIQLKVFQDSGVYILQNDKVKLVINGTNCNVKQYWPHGHNDKLSFSVNYKGKNLFRDPGSYVYNGNPKMRNQYRSVKSHNSPYHGKEQNTWLDGSKGIFRLIPKSKVSLIGTTEKSLKLSLVFDDVIHIREWTIKEDSIIVRDESNKPFDSNFYPLIYFSNGYGRMLEEFA